MEKGFDDKELADIMNEIEELEKDFSEESSNAQPKVIDQDAHAPVKLSQSKPVDHLGHSSLHFKVSGQMKMNLSFEVGSEVVHFELADECLKITLGNGTCLNVPLSCPSKLKKVA